MKTLEERFSVALHSTARSWRQVLDRRMKDLGISQAGWMTVAMVAKAKQPQSQISLANDLGIEGPSMVAMLDRLVKAGLITREPSPTDRRIKLVVLTEDGHALYRQVNSKATALRTELLRDIDPDQLLLATSLLERLQAVLESEA
ncbi:Transcriptional regulator [Collimonas arenae]|uniref:Transcriptional regulator n=1 Tax=Collimonas arenae TaxID=279058 RepID=A0A0A1FEC9_9BURK|nr:MarR family transcriptional regulator [Collimonas arenae]AIY42150.1 Transcriptional regulator [Collimonas arenae]